MLRFSEDDSMSPMIWKFYSYLNNDTLCDARSVRWNVWYFISFVHFEQAARKRLASLIDLYRCILGYRFNMHCLI